MREPDGKRGNQGAGDRDTHGRIGNVVSTTADRSSRGIEGAFGDFRERSLSPSDRAGGFIFTDPIRRRLGRGWSPVSPPDRVDHVPFRPVFAGIHCDPDDAKGKRVYARCRSEILAIDLASSKGPGFTRPTSGILPPPAGIHPRPCVHGPPTEFPLIHDPPVPLQRRRSRTPATYRISVIKYPSGRVESDLRDSFIPSVICGNRDSRISHRCRGSHRRGNRIAATFRIQ